MDACGLSLDVCRPLSEVEQACKRESMDVGSIDPSLLLAMPATSKKRPQGQNGEPTRRCKQGKASGNEALSKVASPCGLCGASPEDIAKPNHKIVLVCLLC